MRLRECNPFFEPPHEFTKEIVDVSVRNSNSSSLWASKAQITAEDDRLSRLRRHCELQRWAGLSHEPALH